MHESFERITIKDFKPKGSLNPKVWHDGLMDSRVRLKLMDIASDFFDTLDIRWVKPEDVVVTGSMANYNWNDFSDIDVHIIVDYSKVYKNKDFVKSLMNSKRFLWQLEHQKLKIFGFPVEIYVEDTKAPSKSGGVYSLNKNEWIKEPEKMDGSKVDYKKVKSKAQDVMEEIDSLLGSVNGEKDLKKRDNAVKKIDELLGNLSAKRKRGLATKQRELSAWNIVWKMLRAEGYLERMHKAIVDNYDKQNTIKEGKTVILSEVQKQKFFG